ncbi:hypothetical protein Tco_0065232 [Tanacetum coccineum]
MVAYLQKSEGSKGFHQIINFFESTAGTSANGEVELTATIDGQVKTITEASLRRHLKLEDNGGVTALSNSEIFEQLALMGAPETSPSRITSSPSLSPKTHTSVSTPSTSQPPNTQPIPDVEEAVQIPHESPLHSIHSLRRDEGSLSLNELTNLCTSLSNKVQKQLGVFSAATTLIDAAKRRTSVETAQTYTKRRRFVSNSSGRVSTASRTISTADVSTVSELGSTAGVKAKDKGKAIMQESEPPKKVKKRVQVQMSMDEELAKKVFEEEKAKAMAEQEQERINFEAALELKK